MVENWVKNYTALATTENRKLALEIMNAGLDAINTERVINRSISLWGNILSVKGKEFDLTKFKRIKVVGFGKSSCVAGQALEKILESKINQGAIIGLEKIDCKYIETFAGTHPRPSAANVEAGKKIYEIIKDSNVDDLIIVLVSGGGSALLCYPESEYVEGSKLYEAFLKTGGTISEMNTIRKHLSQMKGGGLAKIAYPATIIGLIFSDVPGDVFENVASGPTYKDKTTIADAQKIITKNNLGEFNLIETPKEKKYFKNVHNFILVSNKTAVEAMAKKVKELNLEANIISTELYDQVDEALKKIANGTGEEFSQVLGSPGPYPGQTMTKSFTGSVNLAAGEPRVTVPKDHGKGGRNLHMGLEAVRMNLIKDDEVFISFASDGMDNSDAAGAIVDKETIKKAEKLGLDVGDYSNRFDSYNFFQKTGNIIQTGPTNSNVSDLMVLITKR
jgi:glycerate 2-kinase